MLKEILILLAAPLYLFANQSAADFFVHFDSENGSNGSLNYSAFADFDVTSGNVDLIGNGFYDSQPGNGLYVDLNGDQSGALTSKTLFAVGSYELSLDLYNRFANSGRISLGSFSYDFAQVNEQFERLQFAVTLAQPAPLVLQSLIGSADGPYVDNIALRVSGVPEPSLTTSVLGLALVRAALLQLRIKLRSGWRNRAERKWILLALLFVIVCRENGGANEVELP